MPTPVAQVKLHFPQKGLGMAWNLEEIPIPHRPFLLLEGAGEEAEQR